jgi:N-acylneuraminate cytidylyltransferase
MINAIIPLKKNSVRVPNKNFKIFGDTTLIDLKIETLLKVSNLDLITINSDSNKVLDDVYKKYGDDLKYVKREAYYASSECSGSEFFENIAQNADGKTLVYSPVTSPFLSVESLERAIKVFKTTKKFDSVISVHDMKHHMWKDGKPLNYDPYNSPNSQDLPTIYKITYGFGIIPKDLMIEKRNIMGDNPYFYELNEFESVDIDTELEFDFAELLYMKKKENDKI